MEHTNIDTQNKKNGKFEETYFKGWYKKAVGEFSELDLEASKKWFWAWVKKLGKHIPLKNGKGKNVLEIGCSIGAVSNMLVQRGFKVWASDISEYAVNNAKKLTPEATFLLINVEEKIPLDIKFDIIIALEVVEHLENPEKAIENMYERLAEGGKLVISTPYPHKWNFRDPTHINLKYPDEWQKIMVHTGLNNVRQYDFALIPFFYRFSKYLQIIIPFHVSLPYINSPTYYIGEK